MMAEEFPLYFNSVLESLPDSDKTEIKEYWSSFNAFVMVISNDAEIDQIEEDARHVISAASAPIIELGSYIVSCQYCFRGYVRYAPSYVLDAIIKHELAHTFQVRLLNKAFQDTFNGSKQDLISLHKRACDEGEAREICYRWGGDQDLASQWLEQSVT